MPRIPPVYREHGAEYASQGEYQRPAWSDTGEARAQSVPAPIELAEWSRTFAGPGRCAVISPASATMADAVIEVKPALRISSIHASIDMGHSCTRNWYRTTFLTIRHHPPGPLRART